MNLRLLSPLSLAVSSLAADDPKRVEGFGRIIFAHNNHPSATVLNARDFRGASRTYMTAGWWAPGQVKDNRLEWETAACPDKKDTVFHGWLQAVYEEVKDKVEAGTRLISHVVVTGNAKIGSGNVLYPGSVVGMNPQDLKFKGENTGVEIGNNNHIREHATVHAGTAYGATINGGRSIWPASHSTCFSR